MTSTASQPQTIPQATVPLATPATVEPEDLGYDDFTIQRELDRVKSRVFLGNNAAFLGSIMSSMEFHWSRDVSTAATNGAKFWWNPDWFMTLEPDTRKTVLVHELWHAALLHMIRMGNRDPKIWNYACDIRINNDLELEGYTFEGTSPWKDQQYGKQAEEDIYDVLYQNQQKPPPSSSWGPGPCTPNGSGGQGQPQPGSGGQDPNGGQQPQLPHDADGDMIPISKEDKITAVNNVVKAIHQAKLAGCGNLPGNIEQIVESFLAPVIPWETELHKFFTDMLDEDYTWARPNRRFQDIYLPSRFTDDGRLDHLLYFQDVSGSITDPEILRFNSELKYVWDTLQPRKMTVAQFDTRITKVDVFEEGDPYNSIHIVGRGGTCLIPVREMIEKEQPTAAVIFTDLMVAPMQPLTYDIPILWCSTMTGIQVPFGKLLHIPRS